MILVEECMKTRLAGGDKLEEWKNNDMEEMAMKNLPTSHLSVQ